MSLLRLKEVSVYTGGTAELTCTGGSWSASPPGILCVPK